MNLLLINYEYPPVGGGAGNATFFLAREFVRLGHDVTVLTSACGEHQSRIEEERLECIRIDCGREKPSMASVKEMAKFTFHAWRHLGSIIQKKSIDHAIVFFSLPCGPLGVILEYLHDIPYVISLRGGDVPGLVPELNGMHKWLTPMRRLVLSRSIANVANAEGLAQLSRESDPQPVRVIPNGVDCESYQPAEVPEKKETRFLFVGRFQHQKNLFFLLDQLARLEEPFHMDMVGDGPLTAELKKHVEQARLQDKVTWHGWLEKPSMLSMYQHTHVLINPSHYEGLPNVLLEGMACALPVIASDIPGNNDLVCHEENGLLCDPKKGDSLLAALRQMCAMSAESLRKMGDKGRRKVQQHHAWPVVAGRYEKLLLQADL